eukprot:CAMPEP_0169160710 /NCGR_PEP_ID=MMETSP1015-20121227/56623_1 /TAXON_ID=342587 /ORGANISM="Karlodinium micrum, Strain CCMP2283" /LENGTH=39 /DNA_ID= /DNA_START= /DNA_END= /DNA_ORIENTATION=
MPKGAMKYKASLLSNARAQPMPKPDKTDSCVSDNAPTAA